MKRLCLALVLVMVFALAAITLGCNSSMEGYKTFTLRAGNAHFSIEYPMSYQTPSVDRTAEPYITSVTFIRIVWEGEKYSVLSTVDISIYDSTYYSTDASAFLEGQLSKFEEEFLYDDFQLLERSPVTISGIQGEQIIYSYTWIPVWHQRPTGEEPQLRQGRRIYFYSNGMIWELTLDLLLDEIGTATADFEHLLETFQILD